MISMTLPQHRRRECLIGRRKVRLVPMHSKVLSELLVAGPDRFVSRTELIEVLWPEPDFRPEYAFKMVDICICGLRSHGVILESYYGVGWRIPRSAREAVPEGLAA